LIDRVYGDAHGHHEIAAGFQRIAIRMQGQNDAGPVGLEFMTDDATEAEDASLSTAWTRSES
jgi:hypothetical protein